MIPSAFNREEMLKNMKEMAGIEHINSAQIVFIKADIEGDLLVCHEGTNYIIKHRV